MDRRKVALRTLLGELLAIPVAFQLKLDLPGAPAADTGGATLEFSPIDGEVTRCLTMIKIVTRLEKQLKCIPLTQYLNSSQMLTFIDVRAGQDPRQAFALGPGGCFLSML